MENWKTWELDFTKDGREYLEILVCGTIEYAQEVAEEKSKETGRTYTIKPNSFPSYLKQK